MEADSAAVGNIDSADFFTYRGKCIVKARGHMCELSTTAACRVMRAQNFLRVGDLNMELKLDSEGAGLEFQGTVCMDRNAMGRRMPGNVDERNSMGAGVA